jgi:hypothetical protein
VAFVFVRARGSVAATTGIPVVLGFVASEPKQVSRAVPRMNQGRFAAFGSVRLMAAACPGLGSMLAPSAFVFGAEPNKAPEPTPTAVTPRAIECVVEMKQRNPNRSAARGAPAAFVAHR